MELRRSSGPALRAAFVATAKGLANPVRLELLDLLAQGERSVDALASTAGLGVTTTSAHLQTLHASGLVARRRDGTRVLYRLSGDDVAALLSLLQRVTHRHIAGVEIAQRAMVAGEAPPAVEIPRDELVERARAGEIVVLDVRPGDEFAASHLPGARSIPLAELTARLDELPAETPIIAYCRGSYCVLAHDAARLLRDSGRDARVLSEGVLEWRAAAAGQVLAA